MSNEKPLVVRLGGLLPDPAPGQRMIEEAGGTLRLVESENREEQIAAIRAADVVIHADSLKFTPEVIGQLGRCRAIIQTSVGYDNIDVPAATARGIIVGNLPNYCIEEVSDHAVALLLAAARRLFVMQKIIREDKWRNDDLGTIARTGPVERLSERTLGIVGFGNIGRLVNKKARAMFARVLTADPYVKPELAVQHGAELVSLEELLRQSDYVTLHVLLTPETRHLIDAERLAVMKPSAYLVNTCRGPVVDEPALIDALRNNRLAGAGLDVFEPEPIGPENPLAQMDNVIVTPHLAVYSRTAIDNWRTQGFEEAGRVLRGYYPSGMVNRELKGKLAMKEA